MGMFEGSPLPLSYKYYRPSWLYLGKRVIDIPCTFQQSKILEIFL